MSISVTFREPLLIKKSIEILKELISETHLMFKEDGLYVSAMDSTHISMINLFLSRGKFSEYKLSKEITIGLSLVNLYVLIKNVTDDDRVTFQMNDPDNLDILITSTKKNSKYSLKLMDIDSEQLGIPEYDYLAIIRMNSDYFSKIVKEIKDIGNDTTVKITDTLIFSTIGDIAQLDIEALEADIQRFSEDEYKSKFSIQYFIYFSKSASLSTEVELGFMEAFPLQFKYDLRDNSYLHFYLAPKIEDS